VIRNRDGSSRRDDSGLLPSSVPEIARVLRRERTRQGLRIEDVAERTGLPVNQLEGLESGTVDRIPDQVETVQALRRYADFLGLPGERYVLALIDNWPVTVAVRSAPPPESAAAAPAPAAPATRPTRSDDTQSVPAVTIGPGSSAGTATIAAAPAATAGDAKQSAATSGRAAGEGGGSPASPFSDFDPMKDTGVTPAVSIVRTDLGRRRRRAPLLLRIVVVLVALALLAGAAGLIIHAEKPSWLSDIGITHPKKTATATTRPTITKGPGIFSVPSQSSTQAVIDIRSSAFVVDVIPVGSASWMQSTVPQQVAPTFVGVVPAGQTKAFLVASSMTLEVGSASARAFVYVGKKDVGFYFPPSAPFTMKFIATS
jgi:transcriptional regulator with XRE-family HTH domain